MKVLVIGGTRGTGRGHEGFFHDRILQPLLRKTTNRDKDRQESMLRASDVDWTIVRPGFLTYGPATGFARALTNLEGVTAGKVSRADMEFIVENLETGDFHRAAVLPIG